MSSQTFVDRANERADFPPNSSPPSVSNPIAAILPQRFWKIAWRPVFFRLARDSTTKTQPRFVVEKCLSSPRDASPFLQRASARRGRTNAARAENKTPFHSSLLDRHAALSKMNVPPAPFARPTSVSSSRYVR